MAEDRDPLTGALVPLPRREPALPFDEAMIERAFEIYTTVAGRNCAHVQRLLAAEIGDEGPAPTRQTVHNWSIQHAWRERADVQLRETAGRTAHELALLWRSIVLGGAEAILAAQTGAFDDDPAAGAVRLKAAEIGLRPIISGAISLSAIQPPPDPREEDEQSLTREEREARVMAAIARGGRHRW